MTSTVSPARERAGRISDAGSDAWALLLELFQAQRARYGAIASALELSPMQAHALSRLDPSVPVPMNALAETLSCDASNVTGIVDRLESRGLVERQAAPQDRRVKMLSVTPKGAAVRSRFLRRLHAPPPEIRRLPAADQRALRRILARAVDRQATWD